MKPRILVVDATDDTRQRLCARLAEAGYEVSSAKQGAEALRHLEGGQGGVLVILEVVLPDMSGTDVLRRVREHPKLGQIPVMLVSARSDEIDRVIGFELGADDYVVKPFSERELVLRVAALLRRAKGTNGASPDELHVGPMEIDVPRHEVRVHGAPVAVTALEFRLLLDLARRRGRVQRREELLERVWRYPGDLDTRTVDTHVKRLREKLGAARDYIETVRGVGYRFVGVPLGDVR